MSNNILAKYAFLPWARQGFGLKIQDLEDHVQFGSISGATGRPQISVEARIYGDDQSSEIHSKSRSLEIAGPGDVIGIDPRMIIRSEPANQSSDFEPYHLPCIEFYDEDFPWRYSPASPDANQRLRPWLSLIVLKETEFSFDAVGANFILPSITVPAGPENGPFPNPGETWAWAHVQFNGNLDTGGSAPAYPPEVTADALDRFRNLVAAEPDRACARLVSPRQLEPETKYWAFLLPTFETGRLAGLGADSATIAAIVGQRPSWGQGYSHGSFQNRWPYYYAWSFETANQSDFEALVRRMSPKTLSPLVGKQLLDIQDPRYGMSYTANNGTVFMESALRVPSTSNQSFPWAGGQPLVDDMVKLLNLSEDMRDATYPTSGFLATNPYLYVNQPGNGIEDDPVITPPIYGRWHALVKRLQANGTNWVHELNLDPKWRAVAGMGAKVVRDKQDKFMEMAWSQVGEIMEANKQLLYAQYSQQASSAMYRKHLEGQPQEQSAAMTATTHARIRPSGQVTTVFQQVADTNLPQAALSYPFRRIRRPNGPLMKRIDPQKTMVATPGKDLVLNLANNTLNAAQPPVAGSQTASVTATALGNKLSSALSLSSTNVNYGVAEVGSYGNAPGNNTEEAAFAAALADYDQYFNAANWQAESAPPVTNLGQVKADVEAWIDPSPAMKNKVVAQWVNLPEDPMNLPPDRIIQAAVYPVFPMPAAKFVEELSMDFLISNLNLIPNNSISLLETNQKFVEAFLAGLNHEMGRELLWREFPTDHRGSYFRQFWDSTDAVQESGVTLKEHLERHLDIEEMHTWASNTALGTHSARAVNGQLVLVIRGDLLRKFPSVVIYAVRAKFALDTNGQIDPNLPRLMEDDSDVNNVRYPLYGTQIEPDITFMSFDLTAVEANGDRQNGDPGWFFVIKERPGETRFGFDTGTPITLNAWSDVNWANISKNPHGFIEVGATTLAPNQTDGLAWGSQSADMAAISMQSPFMAAIHADQMIP